MNLFNKILDATNGSKHNEDEKSFNIIDSPDKDINKPASDLLE